MSRRRRWLKAVDIHIEACYFVRLARGPAVVKVRAIESPGIWSVINQWTGKTAYVALRDLIRPVRCPATDWRKVAAGDAD